MNVLVVCEWGINRSVTIAGQLKFWGHDVLTAGTKAQTPQTMDMLSSWADRIIAVDKETMAEIPPAWKDKAQLWDVGMDIYPRPYNPDLLRKVRGLMSIHRDEYKPTS